MRLLVNKLQLIRNTSDTVRKIMSLKYTVAIGDWRESNRIGLLCCGQNRTIHKPV